MSSLRELREAERAVSPTGNLLGLLVGILRRDALPSYKEAVLSQQPSTFDIPAFWRSTVGWFGYQHSIFLLDYAEESPTSLALDAVQRLLFGDRRDVVLKVVHKGSEEAHILAYFSRKECESHEHNHVIPVLETLHPPEYPHLEILVMPRLLPARLKDLRTYGEVISLVEQLLHGLAFMHESLVAIGGDININTGVMMDAYSLFSDSLATSDSLGPPSTRTEYPVRYYFICFEHGRRNAIRDELAEDVYTLGQTLKDNFVSRLAMKFNTLSSLSYEMMEPPTHRGTMCDILETYGYLRKRMPPHQLRSRLLLPRCCGWVNSKAFQQKGDPRDVEPASVGAPPPRMTSSSHYCAPPAEQLELALERPPPYPSALERIKSRWRDLQELPEKISMVFF